MINCGHRFSAVVAIVGVAVAAAATIDAVVVVVGRSLEQ